MVFDRPVWTIIGIACLVGLVATSCSQPSPPVQEPTRIATPPTDLSSDPTSDPEITRIWSRFWSQSWLLDEIPQPQWRPMLSGLADDPLAEQLVHRKTQGLAGGLRLYGQVQPHVTAVQVRGDRAIVTDCQDTSRAGQADLSGHPRTVGIAGNRVLGTLHRTPAGWRVSQVDYVGGGC